MFPFQPVVGDGNAYNRGVLSKEFRRLFFAELVGLMSLERTSEQGSQIPTVQAQVAVDREDT